jgi:hypothetical protein
MNKISGSFTWFLSGIDGCVTGINFSSLDLGEVLSQFFISVGHSRFSS